MGERLKGALNHEPPKAATRLISFGRSVHPHALGCGCRPDYPFIKPDRRNKIPSSPENLASEILYSASEAPRYRNCALPLDVPHHVRYRIFRRDADAHAHVIRHDVPFYNLRFLVRRKFVEYLTQMLAQHPKYPLSALLRNEYHMVLTIPSCVGQTLILFHLESPSLGRDRRFPMTVV